nr:cyclic nucleotide-binding and patatin-like phospholipase domain-containing protein [Acuticoccus mangrovi]
MPPDSILSDIGALSALSPAMRGAVAARMERHVLTRGERLITAGEAADALYIVARGRFQVMVDHGRRVIAEIGTGEPVGEIAFFADVRRTADVVAARDSEVLSLSRADYDALVHEVPEIAQAVLAAIAGRLADVTAAAPALSPKPPGTLALCPAGGGGAVPDAVRAALVAALAEVGGVTAIGRDDLPAGIDRDDEGAIGAFLQAREGDGARILLTLEGDGGPFDRTALRQSDVLLLAAPLAEAGDGPLPPSPLETYALGFFRPANRALLLWRERAAMPIGGTRHWLAGRPVHLHHHVACDQPADFSRLARILAGRALGIVMAGGGALGCAHLGVVRALEEDGAVFDVFGGTSVGAAMSTGLASGLPTQDVLEIAEQIFVENRAMRRFTVPIYSLLDHHVLDSGMRHHYGERRLEDLPRTAYAVSVSLTHNEVRVHRHGRVWEAVRASSAIPAVYPPFVTAEGEVLVDGAVLDNQPVGIMRELKAGPNVVIGFEGQGDWRVAADYEALPTRARLVREFALGRHRQTAFPKLSDVLLRAMMINSHRVMKRAGLGEGVLIVPPLLAGMGVLDWQRGRELEEVTYRHTAALIEAAGGFAALLAGVEPSQA